MFRSVLTATAAASCLLFMIQGAQALQSSTNTTINFVANSVTPFAAVGAFSETDNLIINYDFARILPLCNADLNTPNTTVTAFYLSLGSVHLTTLLDTRYQINTPSFTLLPTEAPGPISFWFTCTTDNSAPIYDSNNGKNYVFTITGAVISFQSGFVNTVDGTLAPNQPILVRYDVTRVNKLCPTSGGDPTLSIAGYYQVNNGPVQSWTVFSAYLEPGSNHFMSTYTEGVIRVSDSGRLAIWFSCQSHTASGWDSNFSKNYVYNL